MSAKKIIHHRTIRVLDPDVKEVKDWPPANRACLDRFKRWMQRNGNGKSTIQIYGAATRWALAWLDKPHWLIDPEVDIQRAAEHIRSLCESPSTWDGYRKGLNKFAEFLRHIHGLGQPEKPVNWEGYIGILPKGMQEDVRSFIHHIKRSTPKEKQRQFVMDNLGTTARFLRWAVEVQRIHEIEQIDTDVWFAYLDYRIDNGIGNHTLNVELSMLKKLLWFLFGQDRPVCERVFRLRRLSEKRGVPKDVDLSELQKLLAQIEREMHHERPTKRRLAIMDRAWVLLMLHCGLRTIEIRDLKPGNIRFESKKIHLEGTKSLRERVVYMSDSVVEVLRAYLSVRGDPELLPENVFLFWHRSLSRTYCLERLRTYSRKAGLRKRIRPHQLRHSFASLILNAGAPVETVQLLLGHMHVETTLGYARVYDGTAAADVNADPPGLRNGGWSKAG